MSKNTITFFAIALPALVLAGSLCVLDLIFSLWFPWYLIPHQDSRMSFALDLRQKQAPLFIQQATRAVPTLQDIPRDVSLVIYTTDGTNTHSIVLPTLRNQVTSRAALESSGWNVERIGPYLSLHKGDHIPQLEKTSTALVRTIKAVVMKTGNRRPLSLGYIPATLSPLKIGALSFITTARGRTIDLTVSEGSSVTVHKPLPVQVYPQASAALVVPPSLLIATLDDKTINSLNDLLAQKAGFTHTKPKILESLLSLDQVSIIFHDNTVVIGGSGQPQSAVTTIRGLLEDEERAKRLEKRPFTLPDGSRGFEYIPGGRQPVLTISPDANGCLTPVENRTSVSLCQADNRFLFGQNTNMVQQYLKNTSSGSFIDVRPPFTSALNIPGLESLLIMISQPSMTAHFEL